MHTPNKHITVGNITVEKAVFFFFAHWASYLLPNVQSSNTMTTRCQKIILVFLDSATTEIKKVPKSFQVLVVYLLITTEQTGMQ